MSDQAPSLFDLSTFLVNLTSDPGVYRMRNALGEVIYVGKAKNLKKRVSSYFNQIKNEVKTQALVRQIACVDVTVTRTETEAFLLESTLIKSLRPRYNVLMRDDKSYPYLFVDVKHNFPSLSIIRTKQKPKDKGHFGPYPGVVAVRETLNLIQKIFKLRNCSDIAFKSRTRPCLQYQLKRCTAPCVGLITDIDYQRDVSDTMLFLQGKSSVIIDELTLRMRQAADRLAFEEARLLRDQIKALRVVQEQQSVVHLQGELDVIVVEASPGFGCVQWVSVRHGLVIDNQTFFPRVPKEGLLFENLWEDVFLAFITQYYMNDSSRIPPVILTDHVLVNHDALETLLSDLRGSRCRIQTRSRTIKAKWLDFARNNLNTAIVSKRKMASSFLLLKEFLNIEHPMSTMVCFDISHTQGAQTVASCVVFNEEGPLKKAYRRFNITGITPGDDYAAMEQAIGRYFKRAKEAQSVPDFLVIDGGKGQRAVALRMLETLQIEAVTVLGIAKGPGRKAGLETLIMDESHVLSSDSPVLHLLQYIRDEAHRFAIQAHRKKREKNSLSSTLMTLPGVGIKRRHALLQYFGGLQELSKASVEAIERVPGISKALAIQIHQYFQSHSVKKIT